MPLTVSKKYNNKSKSNAKVIPELHVCGPIGSPDLHFYSPSLHREATRTAIVYRLIVCRHSLQSGCSLRRDGQAELIWLASANQNGARTSLIPVLARRDLKSLRWSRPTVTTSYINTGIIILKTSSVTARVRLVHLMNV